MAKLKYMEDPSIRNYTETDGPNNKNKTREWSNDEITNLVGTVATGASQLVSSFSWLKKPSYQDDPYYSYYPSYNDSGSSSLIWIIGGVAVLALVLFIALKN